MGARVRCEVVTSDHWPAIETLFGANGACGGCFCMHWRQERGEPWEKVKGAVAKRRLRVLVERGEANGVLAFAGDDPVGWCAYGRRADFVKLDRAPSFACDDASRVHALPCFFVRRDFRGKGVATAMLGAAVNALRADGARVIEGYPVRDRPRSEAHPAAFAWTGTESLFRAHGFTLAPGADPARGKIRVRKTLRGG